MKKLTITGNVGKTPDVRTNADGEKFVVFTVAVAVGTKSAPKVDWVEVSYNRVLSEYVTKGSKVLVEGFPAVTAYINSDNEPVAVQKLYANTIEVLGCAYKKPEDFNNQNEDNPQ